MRVEKTTKHLHIESIVTSHNSVISPPYFQVRKSKTGTLRQMSKKRDAKVTKLVVWMNFAFLTCWLPYGIIVILSIYGGEGYVQPMYIVIPLLASKSSVCWNPFLYVCMNFQVIYIFFIVNKGAFKYTVYYA